jgi:peptidyl-prolyl cis-trans isomerase C
MNHCKAVFLIAALALPAFAAEQDQPLVRAKSFTITKQDFEAEILKVPEKERPLFLNNQKRINETLQNLVINRAIAEDAKRKGIDKDPIVQKELQIAQERALALITLDRIGKEAPGGNLEVAARETYRLEKYRYTKGVTVNTAHILITTQKRDAAAAKALAQEVRRKLINKENTFEELVAQYSEDPSAAQNKGELGMIEPKRMVKPYADAAANLKKVGDLSDVVESDYGFHIIQLRGRVEGVVQPFEEVKDDIIEEIKFGIARKAKNAYTSSLIDSEKADANTEAVAALRKPLDFDAALKKPQQEQAQPTPAPKSAAPAASKQAQSPSAPTKK